jgi:ribokinase
MRTAIGFVFAIVVALSEGQPLSAAVRFSNAAAALSMTWMGAQPSVRKHRDIERRLRVNTKTVRHART